MHCRYLLYFCIFLFCLTMFRNQNHQQTVNTSSIQNFPLAVTVSTANLGIDADKRAICTTAKNLYKRVRNERKDLTWEQVFEFLILNFKTEQNNPKAREELIQDAKKYCPTYDKAIEVLNEQQR